jgi:hypothetical protein
LLTLLTVLLTYICPVRYTKILLPLHNAFFVSSISLCIYLTSFPAFCFVFFVLFILFFAIYVTAFSVPFLLSFFKIFLFRLLLISSFLLFQFFVLLHFLNELLFSLSLFLSSLTTLVSLLILALNNFSYCSHYLSISFKQFAPFLVWCLFNLLALEFYI